MIHAALSFLFCLFVAATHGNSEALFLPAIWYAGREFAQAEYRYIAEFCGGKRAVVCAIHSRSVDGQGRPGLAFALACLPWHVDAQLLVYPWLTAASSAGTAFVVGSPNRGMPWTSLPAD